MTVDRAEAIAIAFTRARRAATPLASFPVGLPANMEEAYAAQEAAIAHWPDRIAGWKVAGVAPEFRALGASRLHGPAFLKNVRYANGDRPVPFRIFVGGFAAVEAEFIIRVASPPTPEDVTDLGRLAAAAASLHVGVEVASSPLASINEHGPLSVIADFGNNAGLIVGPPIPNWREREWDALSARATINGRLVGEGDASRVAGGPLAAFAYLVEALAERGRRLEPGDFVSTGMTTGIHLVEPGDAAAFDFSDGLRIAAVAEAARPIEA